MSEFAGRYEADGSGNYRPAGYEPAVRFDRIAEQSGTKSENAGGPVFDAVTVVRVQHPGENDEVVLTATQAHKRRWPRAWAAFEQSATADLNGMPLSLLFPKNEEVVANLRARNVHTVEQLAGLSGAAVATIGMGASDWSRRAQDYLENARTGAPLHKVQGELEREREQRQALEKRLDEMERQLAAAAERGKKVKEPAE